MVNFHLYEMTIKLNVDYNLQRSNLNFNEVHCSKMNIISNVSVLMCSLA